MKIICRECGNSFDETDAIPVVDDGIVTGTLCPFCSADTEEVNDD